MYHDAVLKIRTFQATTVPIGYTALGSSFLHTTMNQYTV